MDPRASNFGYHEQEGPSGSNNLYPQPNNTMPVQQRFPSNPMFRSNTVYGESSRSPQQHMFNISSRPFQPNAGLVQQGMSSHNFTGCPAHQRRPSPYDTSIGYGGGNLNRNIGAGGGRGRGAFTSSQLMELQNQTYIYKYISAKVPIPPHLLTPLTNSLYPHPLFPRSPPFYSSTTPMRWVSPHPGYGGSPVDPEPGRCRRTDGKKWRCAKEVVEDQKYCERHMNRGRHRARRAAEAQRPAAAAVALPVIINSSASSRSSPINNKPQHSSNFDPAAIATANSSSNVDAFLNRPATSTSNVDVRGKGQQGVTAPLIEEQSLSELGIFNSSDSFVDPSQRSSFLINFNDQETNHQDLNSLHHFIDDWPENQSSHSSPTAVNWPDLKSDWTSSDYSLSTSSTLHDQPAALSPLTLPQDIDPLQVVGLGARNELADVPKGSDGGPD